VEKFRKVLFSIPCMQQTNAHNCHYVHNNITKNLYLFIFFSRLWVRASQEYSNIYIQQDATLHSLFYLETALHVSGVTTTHHQERKQMYLQHLVFVTPLLLPAVIAADSSNGVTNTRCCRYSCLRS
jgi:hypothetical protein